MFHRSLPPYVRDFQDVSAELPGVMRGNLSDLDFYLAFTWCGASAARTGVVPRWFPSLRLPSNSLFAAFKPSQKAQFPKKPFGPLVTSRLIPLACTNVADL